MEYLASQQLGEIIVSEPNIQQLPEKLSKLGIELDSTASTISKADIIVLLVDHDAYKDIDRLTLNEKVVIDTRGVWK